MQFVLLYFFDFRKNTILIPRPLSENTYSVRTMNEYVKLNCFLCFINLPDEKVHVSPRTRMLLIELQQFTIDTHRLKIFKAQTLLVNLKLYKHPDRTVNIFPI